MKGKHKKLLISITFLCGLIAIVLILSWLRTNAAAVEFFSKFANLYGKTIGALTSQLPFSLFEALVIIFVISSLVTLIIFVVKLKNRKIAEGFTKIVNLSCVIMFAATIYMATASFSYYKPQFKLGFEDNGRVYSYDVIEESIKYYFDDFYKISIALERDEHGQVKIPYPKEELFSKLREEFYALDIEGLYDFVPIPKEICNSWFMTQTSILGISFMPTVEPNYNKYCPTADLAFTLAHEICHSLGIMKESDANFLAYYLLLNSEDIFLRYSGYINSIFSLSKKEILSYYGKDKDRYQKNVAPNIYMSSLVKIEMDLIDQYWSDNYSFISKIGNFFNDLYLKLSGMVDGTGNYYDPPIPPIAVPPTDDDGIITYIYPFTRIQKMYFEIYLESGCNQ